MELPNVGGMRRLQSDGAAPTRLVGIHVAAGFAPGSDSLVGVRLQPSAGDGCLVLHCLSDPSPPDSARPPDGAFVEITRSADWNLGIRGAAGQVCSGIVRVDVASAEKLVSTGTRVVRVAAIRAEAMLHAIGLSTAAESAAALEVARAARACLLGLLLAWRGHNEVDPILAIGGARGQGTEPADRRIAAAMEHVRRNAGFPWTVAALARHACLSPSRFASVFRRDTGQSVMTFVERIRMTEAARRLLGGRDSVSRIAGLVGYENLSSFCRAFARAHGTTPRAFRRMYGVAGARTESS